MNQHGPMDDFDTWVAGQLRDRQPYLEAGDFTESVMASVGDNANNGRIRRYGWVLLLAVCAVLLSFSLFLGLAGFYALIDAFMGISLMKLLQLGAVIGLVISFIGGFMIWRALRLP
jgi:hypothetical protein